MVIKIKSVETLDDLQLRVNFTNGFTKIYNIMPILDKKPEYAILKDRSIFDSFELDTLGYAIIWTDEVDLAAEKIWYEGVLESDFREEQVNKELDSSISFNEVEPMYVDLTLNVRVPKYMVKKLNLMDDDLKVYYDGIKLSF